jgi:hypothetical protein
VVQSGDRLALVCRRRGLRELLALGRTDDRNGSGVSQLSDAELVAQLSDQAKQLGININLINYSFLQQQKPDDERQG